MKLKKLRGSLKVFFQKKLFKNNKPIIVASSGRSGSTILYNSLKNSNVNSNIPIIRSFEKRLMSGNSWDLDKDKLINGVIYKTHALAHELKPESNVKVIFIFGSAVDSVMSVLNCKEKYGEEWIKLHMKHLRVKEDFKLIKNEDILRIKDQIIGWRGKKNVERLIIKYNSLWKYEKEISKFIGFKLNLIPRRERIDYSLKKPEVYKKVKKNYKEIETFIENLPELEILD